jgi:hypothetical protein
MQSPHARLMQIMSTPVCLQTSNLTVADSESNLAKSTEQIRACVPLPQSISEHPKSTPPKPSKPLGPIWQDQDAEFQHFAKLEKWDRDGRMITVSKRITSTPGGRRGIGAARSDVTAIQTLNDDDPDRTTAQMDPNLKLRVDGELAAADGKDDDVPRYRPQARAMLGKKIPRLSFN